MRWVELIRDCSKGKAGQIVEMSAEAAAGYIAGGYAEESEPPITRANDRPKVSNKAMSAKD